MRDTRKLQPNIPIYCWELTDSGVKKLPTITEYAENEYYYFYRRGKDQKYITKKNMGKFKYGRIYSFVNDDAAVKEMVRKKLEETFRLKETEYLRSKRAYEQFVELSN